MENLAERLRAVIAEEGPSLRAIRDDDAGTRPGSGDGWSRKQELGHLLDSATNNRVRIIRAALDGEFTGPSYEAEGWVALGGYNDMSWGELVDLWAALNTMLAGVIGRVPAERSSAPCRIGGRDAVTLEFVIDDYIQHMRHHLDHILGRETMTAYPSAARA